MRRPQATFLVPALVVFGVAMTPGSAGAAPFETTLCPTEPAAAVNGAGSTFQANAMTGFISGYSAACALTTTPVTYGGGGSGAGINSQINKTAAFGGSDVPYTAAQRNQMIAAGGTVETIPVAVGGVTVAYNVSCPVPPGSTVRLRSATLARMYTGAITSWGDPSIVADNPFLAGCGDAVSLTARAEASGTTFAFKDYLSKRNAAFAPPDNSPNWPAGATIRCRGVGNVGEANCVMNNVGAIGYVDFSDSAGLDLADVESSDSRFYAMAAGSCTPAAQAKALPTSAEQDWSSVSLTDGAGAYPICTFTYDLVFRDPARAGTAAGAGQAANLKAFLSFVTSDDGQATLDAARYDALPATAQLIAQQGAANIVAPPAA